MKTSYTKIRSPNIDKNKHPIFYDVDSHIAAGHNYYGVHEENSVHEITHGVNGVLRIRYDKPSFYCLNDVIFVLENTKSTRLTHAQQFLPKDLIGDAYQHYMIEQRRSWDDYPLYIFDEWSAYINGVACIVELIKSGNFVQTDDTFRPTLGKMLQMAAYSAAIIAAVMTNEADYDIIPVLEFWNYQYDRSIKLLSESNALKHRKLYDADHDIYLNKFLKSKLSRYKRSK